MSPKERAKEIFEEFKPYTDPANIPFHTFMCVLMCIDKIIESGPMEFDGEEYVSQIDYWEEVKQEIKKL